MNGATLVTALQHTLNPDRATRVQAEGALAQVRRPAPPRPARPVPDAAGAPPWQVHGCAGFLAELLKIAAADGARRQPPSVPPAPLRPADARARRSARCGRQAGQLHLLQEPGAPRVEHSRRRLGASAALQRRCAAARPACPAPRSGRRACAAHRRKGAGAGQSAGDADHGAAAGSVRTSEQSSRVAQRRHTD